MTETLSDSFKDVIGGTYMNETLKTFHFHYILQVSYNDCLKTFIETYHIVTLYFL